MKMLWCCLIINNVLPLLAAGVASFLLQKMLCGEHSKAALCFQTT